MFTRLRRRTGRDGIKAATAAGLHSPTDRLAEAVGLAQAIDLDVRDSRLVPIPAARPGTLFGTGKVEEIKALVDETEASLVIVDHAVSPGAAAQPRESLERQGARPHRPDPGDLRPAGAHARGRLQVELAHLTYQKGRLVRAWTHLERQRGGGGFLGGPGEAQIELDRRILEERIGGLKRDLEQVVRTRELHRAGRRKVPYPVVAIVGYTNAGKSTLFNRITGARDRA